ncbi:hypothetical protein E2C01_090914 [Portunus trituberculatus]|uniref:Uncharacterized protein n=1 Tax=Portunus trituberculatus TaxID=210409 RepID=A0A5B7JCM1_PORTR|nr:hypothetical protein [Portunus trituberculatus]
MVRDVVDGVADMAVASLDITPERSVAVDFLLPISHTRYSLARFCVGLCSETLYCLTTRLFSKTTQMASRSSKNKRGPVQRCFRMSPIDCR